jgi:hypothetical protein
MVEFSTIGTIFIKVLKLVSSTEISSYSACILLEFFRPN